MATDSFGRLGLPADIAAGDLNQRGRTRRTHAASRATAEGGRGHGWAVLGRPPDILGKADDGRGKDWRGREAEGGDTPERGRIE